MVKIPASLLRRLENVALSSKPKRRRQRRRGRKGNRMNPRRQMTSCSELQLAHASLLQRPFTASIPASAGGFYDGEQGTIARLHLDGSVGLSAAQTAFVWVLHPNTGYSASIAAALSSTAITVTTSYSGVISPGANTLLAVAQKQRALAAAIRFSIPSLSLTNVVGEFAVGVVSLDTALACTSIDQFFTLSQGRSNVTRDLHEVRWFPGSFDSKYSTVNSGGLANTGTDQNDTNAVFVAVRGLPVSTNAVIQPITVTEWTAKPNTGLMVTSATSAGTNHQETVAVLHAHSPGWHHTAKATAERLLEDTVGRVGKFAEKNAPKVIDRGLATLGAMFGL